jgi:hypothetical protein
LLDLDARHGALQANHVKLRNQFHGQKGGRPVTPEGDSAAPQLALVPVGDKDALRRYARARGFKV